jgi:hypothetical protein
VSEVIGARRRSKLAMAVAAGALAIALLAPAAHAGTRVSVQPSLRPYRAGAHAVAVISLRFSSGAGSVPAPLSGAVLRLPAGLRIDLSNVASCPSARVRARGVGGCPAASLVGRGAATLEVHAGSQTLPEHASIAILRVPDRSGHPSFALFGHGNTPLDETTISTAVLEPDTAPYGSRLVVTVPPIPTLQYEPNASFTSLSLTLGAAGRAPHPVVLPRSCPPGGFAFAASFSFADGTSAEESGRLSCP